MEPAHPPVPLRTHLPILLQTDQGTPSLIYCLVLQELRYSSHLHLLRLAARDDRLGVFRTYQAGALRLHDAPGADHSDDAAVEGHPRRQRDLLELHDRRHPPDSDSAGQAHRLLVTILLYSGIYVIIIE